MTVAELMGELEGLPEDAEVRLAFQPNWPLQHTIDGWNGVGRADFEDGTTVIYIAESGQDRDAPYLPKEAREAIGW